MFKDKQESINESIQETLSSVDETLNVLISKVKEVDRRLSEIETWRGSRMPWDR